MYLSYQDFLFWRKPISALSFEDKLHKFKSLHISVTITITVYLFGFVIVPILFAHS